MNKIICEVCGTAYPETDTNCPVCGCVHSGDQTAVENKYALSEPANEHEPVKGGKFSKSNVKKRQRARQSFAPISEEKPEPRKKKVQETPVVVPARNTQANSEPAPEDTNEGGRGLLITVIAVMLVISAAVVFISVKYLLPMLLPDPDTQNDSGSSQQTPTNVPCQQITLSKLRVQFENYGDTLLLTVYTTPSNTTDKVTFYSTNEAVATVSDDGLIKAVGSGQADIVVTCNGHQDICRVSSTAQTPSHSDDSDSNYEFKLNRAEITFTYEDETWLIYSGAIPQSSIIWTTDDDQVAIVQDGSVIAVGEGTTQVHGEYDGIKLSCTIICDFDDNGGDGDGGISEDGGGQGITGYVDVDDALNVRSGPGTNHDAIGALYSGDKVTITEQQTVNGITWGKVYYLGDYYGWVCLDYIDIRD